jgi:hypothetical protein
MSTSTYVLRLRRSRKTLTRGVRSIWRLFLDAPHWPGEYFQKPPIIVVSFNRAHYLRPTLESLRQQEPAINESRVHLFQDGAVNAYNGVRYADDAEIEECVETFREVFPDGHVHVSDANLGICENFLRAERFVFNTLKAPVAYFFEDDMVLSKHYLSAMDMLRRAVFGRRIGYFNACGSFKASLEEQLASLDQVIGMGHLWGFGLKRSHWLAMQPKLQPYYDLVVGRAYKDRPKAAIQAYFRTLGLSHEATSQDITKALITQRLGVWRASTYACFSQYIGKVGVHFTETTFKRYGLDQTTVYPGKLQRVRIPMKAVRSGLKGYRKVFERHFRSQMRALQKQMARINQVENKEPSADVLNRDLKAVAKAENGGTRSAISAQRSLRGP